MKGILNGEMDGPRLLASQTLSLLFLLLPSATARPPADLSANYEPLEALLVPQVLSSSISLLFLLISSLLNLIKHPQRTPLLVLGVSTGEAIEDA